MNHQEIERKTKENNEIKPINEDIVLFPHQQKQVKKILELYLKQRSLSVLDTSEQGFGKTFTGSYLAQMFQKLYGWNVVIIAPNNQCLDQENGWRDLARKHGINLIWSTTYMSLIGRKNKCSHGYLVPNEDDKKDYEPTEKLLSLFDKGVFLILDEAHKATRNSRTHWACAALVKACYEHGKRSRVYLISNTPGNKDEHIPQILRLMGFIRNKVLAKYIPGLASYDWEDRGLGELISSTKRFIGDEEKVDECWVDFRRGFAKKVCENIMEVCIRPKIIVAMDPPTIKYTLTSKNIYLETDESSIEIINKGISMLTSSVRWNGEDVGNGNEWNMGGIVSGLKMIELGKLHSIARYVRGRMVNEPNRKFVLSVGSKNTEHQYILKKMLGVPAIHPKVFRALFQCWDRNPDWKLIGRDMFRLIISFLPKEATKYPTVMNGKTPSNERVDIMKLFQSDSSTCTILIISPGVGAESISLHDVHGKRPRTTMIVPDYMFSRVVQSPGRVYRIGVKSDTEAFIVYSKQGNIETRILNSMIKKTQVSRKLLAEGQQKMFPGEYPHWIEGKKDEELEEVLNKIREACLNSKVVIEE